MDHQRLRIVRYQPAADRDQPTRTALLERAAAGVLTIMLGVAVLLVGLAPGGAASETSLGDKTQHFVAFGVIARLGATAWPGSRRALVFAGLACLGLEVLQAALPLGRQASFYDVVWSMSGAAVGVWGQKLKQGGALFVLGAAAASFLEIWLQA